jgi:outer membrane protein OmpA-like peptidoglycan-associated protein
LEPIVKKRAIILHNLFFATNQTTILPESESALQDLYTMLKENPEIRIRITGHTDNVGSDKANQKLSEGRAKSVRADLINRGINGDRIEAEGKGESQPIDTNDTEEGRQNNRRVEFMIL